ncbi:MAG: DUF6061 family protein [Negativibacillus massiliensis]
MTTLPYLFDPLVYVDLILNGVPKSYLKMVT